MTVRFVGALQIAVASFRARRRDWLRFVGALRIAVPSFHQRASGRHERLAETRNAGLCRDVKELEEGKAQILNTILSNMDRIPFP
jgi:hypothetical protein